MIRRLVFVAFFACGGFVFYIPKWILMGTKGSRDRQKVVRQQAAILRRLDAGATLTRAEEEIAARPVAAAQVGSQRMSVSAAWREAEKMRRRRSGPFAVR